jgi:hypothetical protein
MAARSMPPPPLLLAEANAFHLAEGEDDARELLGFPWLVVIDGHM